MSTIKVDTITTLDGTGNITLSRPLTGLSGSGASLTSLPAANLTGTLPAISGVNLTALNATQLTSGTVPDARFPATLPAASGVNLTNLNGSNISSGTVATARLGSGTANNGVFLRGDGTWAAAGVTGISSSADATAISISADEEVTMPLQPFVELKQTSQASNVTGDGTTYTIAWDTETFDVGSNYASNTFTAPVTGHYLVSASIYLGGMTAAADTIQYNVTFTNRTYCCWTQNVNDLDSTRSVVCSVIGQMDAGDTITQTCRVNGESSNVVDFIDSGGGQSWFTATLLN